MFRTSAIFLALAGLFLINGCANSQGGSSSAAATVAAATSASATSGAVASTFGRVSVDELSGLIERREVAVFDNNGRERYEQGHIPGARWVSYDAVTPEVLGADRNARLVFYCASEQCHACHTAATRAIELGYQNVSILPAGIAGWTAASKPVVAGANPS